MKAAGENREKKEKPYGLSAMVRCMIGTGARRKPLHLLAFSVLFIGIGLSNTAYTFIKQVFFDSVEGMVSGKERVGTVLVYGIVTSLFPILIFLLGQLSSVVLQIFFKTAQGYLGRALNDKAARIDPLVYEDNRFLDQVSKAYVGLEAAVEVVVNVLMILLNQSVYLVSMAVYLFHVRPTLLVMFCAFFIPNMVGMVVRKRLYASLEHQVAPYRRRYEYFEKCLCSREYVKETRLWRAGGFFKKMYGRNLRESTRLNWQTSRRVLLVELGLRFLVLTGYVGTILMLFYYLSKGEIGVGAFAAIFTSLDTLYAQMNDLFNGHIGEIGRNFGPAQNFFAFLKLRERQGLYEEPVKREVMEFQDVSFTYPGSDRPALEHINLTVHRGETIAIVGVNGSGKSTLTRLLIGLYLPTSGRLLIDGRDVGEIAPKALYRGVSAVFQKYQSYKMSVAENVRISDLERGTEPAIRDALEKADFPMGSEKLTEGLETMLGKDFGGIDLSGGQWQRLAIARGLYRTHDIIILDEPTAAIDPLEEADIYRKFAEISRDKTAFIVTHRLGSAQIADRIIVMDEGHIVDMGTHEELMQREGRYRELYHAQAKWYA
ncbi:MAG: ABC transporter ATP-binding protein/permease [Lachnospiraceae bacterium]|nr:ABC transporter ATP-binding protein/permease [Butyrivibrio sp.]MCM1342556.1 ABC transporter ATP-binding protein/permease [Muribaculaceae bacterium]MCM1412221.1 ABC transporter ATP-binding protein/permease [Lachnospiraceae bacterium]